METVFLPSMLKSWRKALPIPRAWFPQPPHLPARTQLPESTTRWRQKPKAVGVGWARRGVRERVVSAERCRRGLLPGPAAPQRPLVCLGQSWQPPPAGCALHTGLAHLFPVLGPWAWLAVSTGLTSTCKNSPWGQAQAPHTSLSPLCAR